MNHVRFRLTREALTLSQGELAEALGVSKRVLARWEGGQESVPEARLEQLEKLAEEFHGAINRRADTLLALIEERKMDYVIMPVYMSDAEYRAVDWPGGDIWPTAKMMRQMIYRIVAAVEAKTAAEILLIPFDLENYQDWLAESGEADNTQNRSVWAAMQA